MNQPETFKTYADGLVSIHKRGDAITWHTSEDIREHLIARKHSIIAKFGPDAIWDIREYLENHWGIIA